MKVKITEYKGLVVIETLKPEEDAEFIPVTKPGQIGSTLINTGKNLGISKEALAIMKGFHVSRDDIGEVDAWKAGDKDCFGWLGAMDRIIGPDAELPNNGWGGIAFIDIPNETSPGAKEAIDK